MKFFIRSEYLVNIVQTYVAESFELLSNSGGHSMYCSHKAVQREKCSTPINANRKTGLTIQNWFYWCLSLGGVFLPPFPNPKLFGQSLWFGVRADIIRLVKMLNERWDSYLRSRYSMWHFRPSCHPDNSLRWRQGPQLPLSAFFYSEFLVLTYLQGPKIVTRQSASESPLRGPSLQILKLLKAGLRS